MTTGNNPLLVKAGIDEVVMKEYERTAAPGELTATNTLFFKQGTTDRGAVITIDQTSPKEFDAHSEEEDIREETIRSGNNITHTVVNYKDSMYIPREFEMDDMHDTVADQIKMFGMKARNTQDHKAVDNTYAGGFSAATTSDAVALYSDSHTSLNGDTIDNLETGVFNGTNLETLVRSLRLQKDEVGELGGHNPAGLLVPVILFPDATEVTESELQTGTANNNLNYFSKIYPGLQVYSTAYLDSTYNTATNANTSYYLVGRFHKIKRWVREGMTTDLIEPRYDRKDRWEYRCRFREVVKPVHWSGTVASSGTV